MSEPKASEPSAQRALRRLVLLAVAVGVLAVDVGVVVSRSGDDEEPDPAEVAEALLTAYRRSRDATFALTRTFTRTFPDGRSITYDERLTQVPPDDRLLVGAGSASGRLDGQIVRCSTSPSGESRCFEGAEAEPWGQEVEQEVANLRSLVLGPTRAYDVTAGPDDGCFTLALVLGVAAPPYGERAVFCYDEATGAPIRIEVRRTEAVDVVETVGIRTDILPADLRPGELGDLVTGG